MPTAYILCSFLTRAQPFTKSHSDVLQFSSKLGQREGAQARPFSLSTRKVGRSILFLVGTKWSFEHLQNWRVENSTRGPEALFWASRGVPGPWSLVVGSAQGASRSTSTSISASRAAVGCRVRKRCARLAKFSSEFGSFLVHSKVVRILTSQLLIVTPFE